MNPALIEKLVRFHNPAKALPYLPGLAESQIAQLFGLSASDYRGILDGLDAQARQAAAELLTRPGVAAQVDRLPFTTGRHVVAVGESGTADRLSWFALLRHLYALRRPLEEVSWTNLAVAGRTTTAALAELPGIRYARGDWVLCQLGGNDAQRLGGADGPRLVGATETARNLAMLHDLTMADAAPHWLWLTPSSVDDDRVAEYPHFKRAQISWRNADVADTADFMLARPEPTVDTRPVTVPSSDSHGEDGLHLSLSAQQAVAGEVLRTLAGAAG